MYRQERSAIRKLFIEFGKENRYLLAVLFIQTVIEALLPFGFIILSGNLLDKLASDATKQELIVYAIFGLGIILILQILNSALHKYTDARKKYLLEVQNASMNEQSMKIDYQNLENAEIQQLKRKQDEFTNMTGGLYRMLMRNLERTVKSVFAVIFSFKLGIELLIYNNSVSLKDNWYIAVIMILIATGVFVNSKMLGRINKVEKKYMDKCMEGNKFAIYYLYNILFGYENAKDLRIYNQQPLILEGIRETIISFKTEGRKYVSENRKKVYASKTLSVFSGGLVYLAAGIRAYMGMMSIGSVVKFAGSIVQFTESFSELSVAFSEFRLLNAYAKYFVRYLELGGKGGKRSIEKNEEENYTIEFVHVSYKYPGMDQYIIKDMSFKISSGSKIAIVGKNGSGKTTLIKLLCRLYDVTEGEIRLNGIDIRKYDYTEYMSLFSVVFQDFKTFSFSLGKNIAASDNVNADKVKSSLLKAGLWERVMQMKDGINTSMGKDFDKNGIDFSGGEKQKAAIARAIYKSGPCMILDEPTAALDPEIGRAHV